MWRYSAYRFMAMKNAPTIQYEIASDAGGKRVVTRANQTSSSRIGLLMDSLSTSTYGHSFVRIGGVLYRIPITHNDSADQKNSMLCAGERPSPHAASHSHYAYPIAGRQRPGG